MASELSVPIPQILDGHVYPTTHFLLKRDTPVAFTLAPVLKNDGTKVDISEVDKSGFYVYQKDQGGTIKTWNKTGKKWDVPANVLQKDRELNPLQYNQDNPDTPWNGSFLSMGEKGKYIDTSVLTGYPQYYITCYFEAKLPDGSVHTGESSGSAAFKLPELGGDIKGGIKFDDDWEYVDYYIKRSSGNIAAVVKLENNGVVVIRSDSGAQITIRSNGNIELSPNAGGKVVIDGNLEINGSYVKFKNTIIHN